MMKSFGFHVPGLLLSTMLFLPFIGCSEETPTTPNDTNSIESFRVFATRVNQPLVELLSMNADGSDQRVLRQNAGVACSPRAGKLLIGTDSNALLLTDLEGNVIRTIPTVDDPSIMVLSPDASKICYGYWDLESSTRQVYTLRVVNADGTGDVEITDQGGWENTVAFSPDSKRVVFYYDEEGNTPDKLYTVKTDGTDLQLVTDNALSLNDRFGGVAWSSTGDRILFSRAWDAGDDLPKIWSIKPDGSDAREMTDLTVPFGLFPSFSPDGTMVLFCGAHSADGVDEEGLELWVMKSDGSEKRRLTDTPGRDDMEVRPQWSPDGKSILCISFEIPDQGDPSKGKLKSVDVATGNTKTLVETPDIYFAFWGWK